MSLTGYLLVLHLLVVQALVPLPCGQMLVGQKLVVTIACEVICLQFFCLWAICLWLLFACDHPYYFKRLKKVLIFACVCIRNTDIKALSFTDCKMESPRTYVHIYKMGMGEDENFSRGRAWTLMFLWPFCTRGLDFSTYLHFNGGGRGPQLWDF